MKVTTEVHISRPQRNGMIYALMDCQQLLFDEQPQYTRSELCAYLRRYLPELWPDGYTLHVHRARFTHSSPLSYKQWFATVLELTEWLQLTAIMGDADKDAANKIHGSKARGLRSKLHLGIDEPPPNPYVSDDEFERQQLEGEIDGYEQVLALAEDASLDDDAFGPRLAQAIFAAWPPDYLDYCKRFLTFFERMPCPPDVGPRLEYEDWCECVDELHALAARCEQAGRRPESNKKYRLMLIKLLRVPGERAPVVEWPRAVNDVT